MPFKPLPHERERWGRRLALPPIPFPCLCNGSKEGESVVPMIVHVSHQNRGFQSQRQPTWTIWELVEMAGFAWKK
jgi:hypothetical protein